MKKLILVIIFIAIIVGTGAYVYLSGYIKTTLEPVDSTDNNKISIEIPSGSSTDKIGRILLENNIIKDKNVFKYYAKKTQSDSKLKAGSYSLSKNMDMDEILSTLISGGISGNTVNMTVIEGLTLEETAKSIEEQTHLDYNKLLDLMNNPSQFTNEYKFIADNKNITNLQGYLMPETYNIYLDANETDVINMMLSEFENFYESYITQNMSNSKLNFEEIINLAAIVEKEAVLDEERDKVAAVFLNRLKIDMKLQSCATVNYAQGVWKERLSDKDIAIDSPYNTYLITGLPPTPINSPGKLSIKAVLEPADVDYLYFVAKGDGSHHFSNNYDDHLAAKNKYLK